MNGLKKSAKKGEANGVPSLLTGPTQVQKWESEFCGRFQEFTSMHISS